MGDQIKSITSVLLAGGRSRRMGRDKRFIDLDGLTLFERTLSVLERLFPEVVVVVAEGTPDLPKLAHHRVVLDVIPDCASLGGLYSGLFHAAQPRVFAVACDMPFLNEAIIRRMVELGAGADVVMVKLATGVQPMHALYSKRCLPTMRRMIDAGNLKIQQLIEAPELQVRLVEEQEFQGTQDQFLSFLNVNTPADLELARKLLAAMGGEEGPATLTL